MVNANFVYMRYADVILILAEAANELSEYQTNAYKYLDEILDRAADLDGDGRRNDTEELYPEKVNDADKTQDRLRELIFRDVFCEFTGE